MLCQDLSFLSSALPLEVVKPHPIEGLCLRLRLAVLEEVTAEINFDRIQSQLSSKVQRVQEDVLTGEESQHFPFVLLLLFFLLLLQIILLHGSHPVRRDVVDGRVCVQGGLRVVGAVRVMGEALDVRGQRIQLCGRPSLWARADLGAELRGDVFGSEDATALLGQLLHVHQDGLLFLLGYSGVTQLQLEVHLALLLRTLLCPFAVCRIWHNIEHEALEKHPELLLYCWTLAQTQQNHHNHEGNATHH